MAIKHSSKTRQMILGYRRSTKMHKTIGTQPCTLRQPWVTVLCTCVLVFLGTCVLMYLCTCVFVYFCSCVLVYLRICVLLYFCHCCNRSIFLPVPIPLPELTQIIWWFRVRFSNWPRGSAGSGSSSRTYLYFIPIPGPVLYKFLLLFQFLVLVSDQKF